MGKVYSHELRAQDAELKKFGAVSQATRMRATSAWVPDFSSYDFGEEFVRWEGIDFKDVQRMQSLWRKIGAEITLSRSGYTFFVQQSGLSKRQSKDVATLNAATSGLTDDFSSGPPLLSAQDASKLEILRQFDSFSAKSKDFAFAQQHRSLDQMSHQTPVTPPRIPALDLLAGLALVSKATPAQKAGFLFGLFDFHRRKKLDRDELLALVAAAMRGYCAIKHAPLPPPEGLAWLVDETLFDPHSLDKHSGTVGMTTFVNWCKRNPSIDVILNSADAVATGSSSAFADRRRALQKKLLIRLARIESSLEVLGEAPFCPDEIRDIIETKLTRKEIEHQAFLGQGTAVAPAGEHDDPGQLAIARKQAPPRRHAQVRGCLVHSWFPALEPREAIREALDPAFAGLSIEQYSAMSEADRAEWSDSTAALAFLADRLEAAWPLGHLMLVAVDDLWLSALAARAGVYLDIGIEAASETVAEEIEAIAAGEECNVADDDEGAPAPSTSGPEMSVSSAGPADAARDCSRRSRHTRDIPLAALVQWIRTWPLAEAVRARSAAGKYWAWARVISPLASALSRAVTTLLPVHMGPFMASVASQLWIGDQYDQGADTCLTMSVGLDPDDTFAADVTLEYRLHAEPARRMEESEDPPDVDEDQVSETEFDQFDYELSTVASSAFLARGKRLYEKVFHEAPMGFHGSLAKPNLLATDGVSAYVLLDFAADVSAMPEALTLAAFKLRVLFTHEYFAQMEALEGAHILEVAEFKGSAKKLRLVVFFRKTTAQAAAQANVEKLASWFGKADVVTVQASVGSNVGEVLDAAWDGELGALWDMSPSSESNSSNLETPQHDHQPHRKRAFDVAWARHLGLRMPPMGKPAHVNLHPPKPHNNQSEDMDELAAKLAMARDDREASRKARLCIAEKRLTSLGHECVAALFQRFDRDLDGALSLEEMNVMQHALEGPQFETAQEYVAALQEDGVLVNHQGYLTLEGLEQLYVRTEPERLAKDLGLIGVKNCSLARTPFLASLRVVGPMRGRTCEDAPLTSKSPPSSCSGLAHVQDVFSHVWGLFSGGKALWREHCESAKIEVSFAGWIEALAALHETMQGALPSSAISGLRSLLFKAGFARALANNSMAFTRGLFLALQRAQVDCLDDEVEDGDADGDHQDEAKPSDDDSVPADLLERKLLKTAHHLCRALQGVVAGIASAEVRFHDDRAILLSGDGLNVLDWFLGDARAAASSSRPATPPE